MGLARHTPDRPALLRSAPPAYWAFRYNSPVPHRHQLDIPSVPGLWPLTWPMGLTMLRLLLLPVFLWLILATARPGPGPRRLRWVAVGVFAVMALTDKLDGYLARRLNQT